MSYMCTSDCRSGVGRDHLVAGILRGQGRSYKSLESTA